VTTIDFVYMFPKTKSSNQVIKQLVNGWELSSMIRMQSGMPLTVNANGNLFGANIGNNGGQYANLIGDPYANTNAFQILNPLAFQRPPTAAGAIQPATSSICPSSGTSTPQS